MTPQPNRRQRPAEQPVFGIYLAPREGPRDSENSGSTANPASPCVRIRHVRRQVYSDPNSPTPILRPFSAFTWTPARVLAKLQRTHRAPKTWRLIEAAH